MTDNIKELGALTTEALLAGFWVAIGFNPFVLVSEITILETASATDYSSAYSFLGPSEIIMLIHLIVAVSTVASILGAWILGGKIGVIALGCAFIGGIVAFTSIDLAGFFIVIAYMLALVAGAVHQSGHGPQPRTAGLR